MSIIAKFGWRKRYPSSGGGGAYSEPLTITPVAGYVSHQYGDEMYDYLAAAADSNDLNYKGFPTTAKTTDGYIYKLIKASNHHWAEGWLQLQRSTDGITWSAINTPPYGNIVVGGTTLVSQAPVIGAIGNRIIVGYAIGLNTGAGWQTSGSLEWTDFAYSDNCGMPPTISVRTIAINFVVDILF